MANKYGSNYTKAFVNVPAERANAGEYGGKVKVLFDQLVSGAVAADVLYIGKLPKGARILELKSIGAGSGAAFNVAAADIMSAETAITLTIGTSPSDPVSAWVYYIVD